jgi:hypothetical protein
MVELPSKSLVLVLGAGASFEFGLPLGAELKEKIANALDIRIGDFGRRDHKYGDESVFSAISQIANYPAGGVDEINAMLVSARHISDAMTLAMSIDNFIDSHRDDVRIATCGKLAVVSCVLAAEKKSLLYVDLSKHDSRLNYAAVDETWLTPFFRLVVENCQKTDVEARLRSIGIITFNYDRTVEHFLFHALQLYYQETPEWAATVLRSLDVHHPYGQVGPLPWVGTQHSIAFGAEPRVPQLIQLSKQLLTFSEGTSADKSSISTIRHAIAYAKRVAFLGFAFHPLNMELLYGGRERDPAETSRPVLGTALKVSKSDVEVICDAIRRLSRRRRDSAILRNLTCSDFFHEYQRTLSLVDRR